VPPHEHATFYCSSALTLNITREVMKESGFRPRRVSSKRRRAGSPSSATTWVGLEQFFEPNREILVAHDADGVLAALSLSPSHARAWPSEPARASFSNTQDTAEEVGIAVIPVGKQRVTKQRYAHTDVSSSRLVRRPPKSSR
jgi:hypothetical protein